MIEIIKSELKLHNEVSLATVTSALTSIGNAFGY